MDLGESDFFSGRAMLIFESYLTVTVWCWTRHPRGILRKTLALGQIFVVREHTEVSLTLGKHALEHNAFVFKTLPGEVE